tara:strand:- start:358 stop:1239 length:882 start_codon:yes stop_codon:yes gene_type:complete
VFGKKKKIKNQEELPQEAKNQIGDGYQSAGTVSMGLNGQNIPEAVPFHDQADCEIVYKNANNAWIVLGRDRPGPKNSGYGGRGATQAGSIDLVVGKMGAAKDGPKSNIYVDPNFGSDAARIYISQKTDIDKNFGLVAGNVGLSVARSGIGIKADAVRLVGREGIKLVTGTGPKERNSAGEKLKTTYGIDLIAGNDDETLELEPMVKGRRLANALKDMNERIDELNGLYTTLVLAVLTHGHPPFMVPSPTFAVQGLAQCLVPAYGQKVKIMADEINNYTPFGGNWICSRHNRVN